MNQINSLFMYSFLCLLLTGCLEVDDVKLQDDNDNTSNVTRNSDGDIVSSLNQGYSMPSGLETLPDQSSQNETLRPSLALKNIFSVEDSQTDFQKDQKRIEVKEQSLEQFDFINTLLDALRQTRYDDPRNINQGPYATIVSWKEDQKVEMEKWIVDSKMIIENGKDVNKINVWIEAEEEGEIELIKAEFKIFAPKSEQNPYGIWTLNADLSDEGEPGDYFTAHVNTNNQGETVLKVDMKINEGEHNWYEKGYLVLSDENGKGVMQSPEHVRMQDESYQLVPKTITYSYNADHVAINTDIEHQDEEFACKDRSNNLLVNIDYKVYDINGANIEDDYNFGFPIKHTDEGERTKYLYYSSWQGRHSISGNRNNSLEEGTEVTSVQHGDDDNTPPEVYTVGKTFQGYLVEKSRREVTLDKIQGEVLEAWTWNGFNLKYNNGSWKRCNGEGGSYDCESVEAETYNLANLITGRNERRHAHISNQTGDLTINDLRTGFNEIPNPSEGEIVWGGISTPIYLGFNGNLQSPGFVEYEADFSQNPHQGTYTLAGDYKFTKDSWFWINVLGVGYALEVKITDSGAEYTLEQELEEVIQPGLGAGSRAHTISAYNIDDGNNPNYDLIDQDGKKYNFNAQTYMLEDLDGNIITQDIRDLKYINQDETEIRFNWNYARNEKDDWKKLSFLNLDGQPVFLDDPIYFKSLSLNNKSYNIGYAGHLFGLPDYHELLRKNGGLNVNSQDEIVNIPDGTVILDKNDKEYLIKASRAYRILTKIDDQDCGVSIPENLNEELLSAENLPEYINPNMGDVPATAGIKVVEGKFQE